MTALLKVLSFLGLALTVGPAFLVFAGELTWEAHAGWMLVGAALWFITAPFWMRDHAGAATATRNQAR